MMKRAADGGGDEELPAIEDLLFPKAEMIGLTLESDSEVSKPFSDLSLI
jgi:hypothetical protein